MSIQNFRIVEIEIEGTGTRTELLIAKTSLGKYWFSSPKLEFFLVKKEEKN